MPSWAQLWCSGKVTHMLTYSSGEVMIMSDYRGDWTSICNIETVRAGVSVSTCKNWAAQVVLAMGLDKTVTVFYPSDPAVKDCRSIPSYHAAPSPGYVALIK